MIGSFFSSDLVYEIPRSLILGCNFLNVVKKYSFGFLDHMFELLPILYLFRRSIVWQIHLAFFIPPVFRSFCNFYSFQMFLQYAIWNSCKFLNCELKLFFIHEVNSIDFLDILYDFRGKVHFLFTIFDDGASVILHKLFTDVSINYQRSMIQWIS